MCCLEKFTLSLRPQCLNGDAENLAILKALKPQNKSKSIKLTSLRILQKFTPALAFLIQNLPSIILIQDVMVSLEYRRRQACQRKNTVEIERNRQAVYQTGLFLNTK